MFDRKIFFRDFFCGGGARQRPSPVYYAYGWASGPHQLNPALFLARNLAGDGLGRISKKRPDSRFAGAKLKYNPNICTEILNV